jgi:hypothetical protein
MKKVKISLLVFVSILLTIKIAQYFFMWQNDQSGIMDCIRYKSLLEYLIIPTFIIFLYKDLQLKKGV